MIYIIDGYNVLFVSDYSPDATEPAESLGAWASTTDFQSRRERFVRHLGDWAKSRGHTLIIFFDGQGGTSQVEHALANVTLHYSSAREKADHAILAHVESLKNPKAHTVVSSDRFVSDSARHAGCAILSSRDFWHDVESKSPSANIADDSATLPKEKSQGLNASDVKHWREIFGYDN